MRLLAMHGFDRRRYENVLASQAVIGLSAAFALYVGFFQLGGYDLSPLIDLGWRFAQGQKPGSDFINTLPNLLLVVVKIFSSEEALWGSLIWANIAATLFTLIVLMVIEDPKEWGLNWTLSISALLCLPLIYTNHIWHSSISQLAAIAFFFALYSPLQSGKFSLRRYLAIGLTAGLVIISKQNVALPILLSSLAFVALAKIPNKMQMIAAILLGAAVVLVGSMLYLGQTPSALLYAQTAVAGRARAGVQMHEAILQVKSHYPLILFASTLVLTALYGAWKARRFTETTTWLCILFFAVSFIPIGTDWDAKLNNLPLPLFVLVTFLFHRNPAKRVSDGRGDREPGRAILAVSYFAVIGIIVTAIAGGYHRERMRHVGPFFEHPDDIVIEAGYFKGMRTGRQLSGVLEELDALTQQFRHKKAFMGPRIEFGYRVTGASSPKGLPLWWHPGSSYSFDDFAAIVRSFEGARFDLLVFLKGDRTRVPGAILTHIEKNYHALAGFRYLDVYVRK